VATLLGGVLLARYNFRQGRGDRRGALRVALFVFAASVLGWVFGASHAPTYDEVARFALLAVSPALLLAGFIWMVYLALEPFVRRRWPHTIISWSRVLSGSLRDPLVGRDVLAGILFGIVEALLTPLENLTRLWLNMAPLREVSMDAWPGMRYLIASGFLNNSFKAILFALFLFFLMFLLRFLTRRQWLATGIFFLLGVSQTVLLSSNPMVTAPFACLLIGLSVIALLRFGLLTFAICNFVSLQLFSVPITTDFSAWYAGNSLAVLTAVMSLAGYAFHTSLGGQKLLEGKLLNE
jgi:serine/threonine-protein kinase